MKKKGLLETHPFGDFVPPQSKYLLLGSFTGKIEDPSYDWFYTNKRNQFWHIMRAVYNEALADRHSKESLFTRLNMALSDIIYQCERQKGTNLDNNLINIIYNLKGLNKILSKNPIKKIFFSSRFVENKFKRLFKDKFTSIELVTLPSPSPRYAKLSLSEKIKRYHELLPSL